MPASRPDAENATASRAASALPQDFETALAQLEALVAAMEDGSLPLEESLAAYRRGVELTRICQERLAQAEQQVRVLEGDLLRPLDPGALDDESNG
ncbi:exodeoxyribonuclease VII small subunit [Bordetella sp. H567]|uniref:exodeoxyribonuclease VII small subunit n=1 Tax=Bordetella sp. H567 TaxID=1697043 RepID=UPI00081D2341|nr:exodeoxyribonuclease VII small subunit [Bordetella sp. H567]AOB33796.1 exodeoxyribonuclease VII small subunit [Bordetella sp. H567]